MSRYVIQGNTLTGIGDAIRQKTGRSGLILPTDMPNEIRSISGGGGGGSTGLNDVNFRDYDGTVVASYTASDFLALSSMPANPSHSGLTARGWNWSLADAKVHVTKHGKLEIGQMYITDDGVTRVYIHLEEERKSPMLGLGVNGTVDVDWGDGTAHDTLTGTSIGTVEWTQTHNYANGGDYVIKLTVTGSAQILGSSSVDQYSCLLRYSSDGNTQNHVYRNSIRKVEVGANASIGSSAFQYCYSLASVVIPDTVTSIGSYAFQYCYSLASVVIPDTVTSIGSYAFQYCYSLASVVIPDTVTSIDVNMFQYCYSLASVVIPDTVTSIGLYAFQHCYSLASFVIPDTVTSIGSSMFRYCYSLASIVIPDTVTSIGTFAFQNCYSLASVHCLRTTPPTLSNTNAFTNIPNDCIIYVPYSADHSILGAYQTANKWSTYASRMQEEAA